MNTTLKLINSLKAKTGAVSDYDLAKKMNITRAAISNYQTGKRIFDDETAVKVASMLEIDPSIVLASIHIERAKSSAEKSVWTDIFERLGGVAAALVLGVSLTATPSPAHANGLTSHNTGENCILCKTNKKKRHRKQRLNPLEMLVNQLLGIA